MALGFYFKPTGFTKQRYDDSLKQLEEAGAGAPPGRLFHFALETDGEIQIFDVWDSQQSSEAFGAALGPILGELGADPVQPQVSRVHNMVKGSGS